MYVLQIDSFLFAQIFFYKKNDLSPRFKEEPW